MTEAHLLEGKGTAMMDHTFNHNAGKHNLHTNNAQGARKPLPEGTQAQNTVPTNPPAQSDRPELNWDVISAAQHQHAKALFFGASQVVLPGVSQALSRMPLPEQYQALTQQVRNQYAEEFPGIALPPELLNAITERLLGLPEVHVTA